MKHPSMLDMGHTHMISRTLSLAERRRRPPRRTNRPNESSDCLRRETTTCLGITRTWRGLCQLRSVPKKIHCLLWDFNTWANTVVFRTFLQVHGEMCEIPVRILEAAQNQESALTSHDQASPKCIEPGDFVSCSHVPGVPSDYL